MCFILPNATVPAGAQKEGAAGLVKGVGKGLVGLIVRPTGGLIDLTSGTLDFVTRCIDTITPLYLRSPEPWSGEHPVLYFGLSFD